MVSPYYRRRASPGFTLVELLVVIAIIVILLGASAALVPSMLHGNQMNEDVTTLQGILEEARETALASNTYVYVGFTGPNATSPADGMSVIVFESQDGTDAANGFGNVTFPTTPDVQILNRIQRLPGVQIADVGDAAINYAGLPASNTAPVSLVGWPTSSNSNLQWVFTTTNTLTFNYGFEFTPNGEAKVTSSPTANWYDEFEFGLKPAIAGQNSKDVAVFRISRVTGKATIYRP
jgi:prepilin-type N-terminal cleavage/methylation domain-containing protein